MDAIGPLQLRVMHHIWSTGPCTVHDVHDALNLQPGAPQLAYTTILTVMRNLVRRAVLAVRPGKRSHTFLPLIDEAGYKTRLLRAVAADLFAGDVAAMAAFASRHCLTAETAENRSRQTA